MKHFLLLTALHVLLAPWLNAQIFYTEQLQQADRPANAPATVGEMLDLIPRQSRGPRTNVISEEAAKESFVIPVAGNAAGSNGTYFRSDVVFNNDRSTTQKIAVGWMAAGRNSCSEPLVYFELSPKSVTNADDFVGSSLRKSGLGALLVVAVLSNGSVDEDGEIDGYSRIWTPQPGTPGTVSQNFTAVDVQDSIGALTATLMGLKQSSQYRTNVGVVNFDSVVHTWTFTSLATGAKTTLTVQPCSVTQVPAISGSASGGNVAFSVRADASGFWWSGFGSSTDNYTGDGWVSRAIQ